MVLDHPLKRYRKAHGLTLADLGKKLGVTSVTVWRWENGARTPRRRQLLDIAEKTRIAPTEFLAFEPEKLQ